MAWVALEIYGTYCIVWCILHSGLSGGFICLEALLQLLIDLLHFLDPVHGHVGVVDDVVWAEWPSFEEVGDEGGGHDFGDELDEEGEAHQGEHDGQSGVEEALAGETHVGVGTEPKTTAVGGVACENAYHYYKVQLSICHGPTKHD